MLARITLALLACLSVTTIGAAQPIYNATPDWVSLDTPVSTGGGLVDLNQDGWLDFVVSNGNDMAQEHVAVYYNQGDGTFPLTPDWESSDWVYNGHLDVADVNGDGWEDIAVATLGRFTSVGPIARVYYNNAGTLSSTPDWSADVIGNAFGVAFGDMNNDGKPDLAVATGWAYDPQNHYHQYVYLNTGTTLEASASWVSNDNYHSQGAVWLDANADGWLDLAVACARARSRVYMNLGGTLETSASWTVLDLATQDAIMVTAGDTTGDGVLDLILADNSQLGGSGQFMQYPGEEPGTFYPAATWRYRDGYCAAVAVADLDCDGGLDLATGGWWLPARLFLNSGSGLPTSPDWVSDPNDNVIERIVFGDIDKNGLRPVEEVHASFTPSQRLFYLDYQPIQELSEVHVDGVPLGIETYHVNRELGWVTIGVDPVSAAVFKYTVSSKLDMALTHWDAVGNYVYYNRLMVRGDANCDGVLDFDDINPFVLLLIGGYEEHFPDCDGATFCDMNDDGETDFGDINGFVAALVD